MTTTRRPSGPPSALKIAADAIQRLVKEQRSYVREMEMQERRLRELEAEEGQEELEGNREFRKRQEANALEQTKAVFKPLGEKLQLAVEKAEGLLVTSNEGQDQEEVEKVREMVVQARKTILDREGGDDALVERNGSV